MERQILYATSSVCWGEDTAKKVNIHIRGTSEKGILRIFVLLFHLSEIMSKKKKAVWSPRDTCRENRQLIQEQGRRVRGLVERVMERTGCRETGSPEEAAPVMPSPHHWVLPAPL